MERLAHSVPELADGLDVAESTIWKHIATGRIRVIRLGGRTLIPVTEWQRLLNEGV